MKDPGGYVSLVRSAGGCFQLLPSDDVFKLCHVSVTMSAVRMVCACLLLGSLLQVAPYKLQRTRCAVDKTVVGCVCLLLLLHVVSVPSCIWVWVEHLEALVLALDACTLSIRNV
jgi:hypothetical protein